MAADAFGTGEGNDPGNRMFHERIADFAHIGNTMLRSPFGNPASSNTRATRVPPVMGVSS
jgi:hypothetical protein